MAKGVSFGQVVGGVTAAGFALWGLARLFPESEESRVKRFVISRVRRAATILGIAAPPVIETKAVSGAASDGRRVLYNHEWVAEILAQHCRNGSCEDQVVLGVVAHELAHHGLGHAFDGQTRSHDKELDADFLAGQVLAIAGAGREHFEAVLFTGSPWPTQTHPAGYLRIDAVRQGYAVARARNAGWAPAELGA